MPLRLRIALLFTLAAAAVGLVGGILFARQMRLGLEGNLDDVLRSRADTLRGQLATEPPSGTGELETTGGIAQLLTTDGTVVDTSVAAGTDPLMTTTQLARAATGTYIIDARLHLPPGTSGGDRTPLRLLGAPGSQPGTVIVVGAEREQVNEAMEQSAVQLVALGVPAVLLAGIGAYVVAGAALRPVERMRRQAAALSIADSPATLAVPSTRDELAALAETLNDLLRRTRATLQQERSFVADAGHELRTPLAILSGELELAARPGRSVEELQETVAVAREETGRLVRLAEQLLLLARADSRSLVTVAPADVVAVVRSSVSAFGGPAAERDVTLEARTPEELRATVDADRLRQALDNLIVNALRHSPAGGRVEVTVGAGVGPAPGDASGDRAGRDGARRDEPWARLEVADRGPGFDPDFLPQAFTRFTRGDPSRFRPTDGSDGSGAGLGLAIVASIVEAHGGTVTAANREGGGAVVTVVLPRGDEV